MAASRNEEGAKPTSIEALQKTVEGLSSAFALPYGQLLHSLENSNKMMEQMNSLLERFVLHAIRVRVEYLPSSIVVDGASEINVKIMVANLSDFPLDQIAVGAQLLPTNSLVADQVFSLQPHGTKILPFTINELSTCYRGTIDVSLPSPGTQALLRKTENWEVPLPLRCARQLRTQQHPAADALPLFVHSSPVSAALLRLLFRQPATALLEIGPSIEYCFVLPINDGDQVCIPTFVVEPIDHSTLLLASVHPRSQTILADLSTLSTSLNSS